MIHISFSLESGQYNGPDNSFCKTFDGFTRGKPKLQLEMQIYVILYLCKYISNYLLANYLNCNEGCHETNDLYYHVALGGNPSNFPILIEKSYSRAHLAYLWWWRGCIFQIIVSPTTFLKNQVDLELNRREVSRKTRFTSDCLNGAWNKHCKTFNYVCHDSWHFWWDKSVKKVTIWKYPYSTRVWF